MAKGRRYDSNENRKLNIKKVIAVIIVFIVLIMLGISLSQVIKSLDKKYEKNISLAYYTVFSNNKWGVINSYGKTVIEPSYDEMIIIPDEKKDIFVITYDVNYENGTYKSKVINSKGETKFSEYQSVEAIQNIDKQNTIFYATTCLIAKNEKGYGLIDLSGKELLECQYDSISAVPYVKNSLITSKDNKLGVVSTTGTILINNSYAEIQALTAQYEDGYIVKDFNGKYGVISSSKKIVVPVEFDKIENFKSGNKYVVSKENQMMLFDSEYATTLTLSVDKVKQLQNDSIIFEKEKKYGVMDFSGVVFIEPVYDDLAACFTNYYIAKKDGKYGVINQEKEVKIPLEYISMSYNKVGDFIECIKDQVDKTEIMDKNLETKVNGIVLEVNEEKGYIKVNEEGNYNYYNFKFEKKESNDVLQGNNLFLDKKNGKYGYKNKEGIVKVNYIYDDATEQNSAGYVSVKKDGKWGAIDQNGDIVVEPTLSLENNYVIDFIGEWHLAEDLNANYYTK